jgi:hypothetical protein
VPKRCLDETTKVMNQLLAKISKDLELR